MIRDTSPGSLLLDLFVYGTLLLVVIVTLYPVLHVASMAISAGDAVIKRTVTFYPKGFSMRAFELIFSSRNIPIGYRNQVMYAALGTTISLILTTAMAYPLSKRRLTLRSFYMVLVVVTMFFGGGLIPTYLLIRGIGLLDDFWVLILPTMTSAFNIIIVRNFLMTIDKSLEESAFLDGASFYQILPKIILPLSKPVMAVIALWAAVQHWNAWFDALIYLPSKDKIVLQLLLRRMLQEVNYFQRALRNFEDITQVRLPSQSARAAVTILTIGPIILFYPFLQRYFVKGIFVGSLKG
jgi:putative aldouronate transport system permease protein